MAADNNSSNLIPILDALDPSEGAWWGHEIKSLRTQLVQSPTHYVENAFRAMGLTIERLNLDMDSAIREARELSYRKYLEDEAKFHSEILRKLTKNREMPNQIMAAIMKPIIQEQGFLNLPKEDLVLKVSAVAGEYVGRIFPYVYQLCLSTTQSRRARAGREFELVIEQIMKIYEYAYEAQSTVGAARFQELELAKAVDFLVPSTSAYQDNRPKCAVITAKTSLRERWQQVAEELQRTNVPAIYLLTLDEAVTDSVLERLIRYNITLVLLESEKKVKFSTVKQVLSFKDFFTHDLPHTLNYWKENNQ